MLINPGTWEERGKKIVVHENQDHETNCFVLEVEGVKFYFNENGILIPQAKHEEIREQARKFGLTAKDLTEKAAKAASDR